MPSEARQKDISGQIRELLGLAGDIAAEIAANISVVYAREMGSEAGLTPSEQSSQGGQGQDCEAGGLRRGLRRVRVVSLAPVGQNVGQVVCTDESVSVHVPLQASGSRAGPIGQYGHQSVSAEETVGADDEASGTDVLAENR